VRASFLWVRVRVRVRVRVGVRVRVVERIRSSLRSFQHQLCTHRASCHQPRALLWRCHHTCRQTIQGFVPFYFRTVSDDVTQPGRDLPLDRCRFNGMADSEECREVPLKEIVSVHFTVRCLRFADVSILPTLERCGWRRSAHVLSFLIHLLPDGVTLPPQASCGKPWKCRTAAKPPPVGSKQYPCWEMHRQWVHLRSEASKWHDSLSLSLSLSLFLARALSLPATHPAVAVRYLLNGSVLLLRHTRGCLRMRLGPLPVKITILLPASRSFMMSQH
jgi:hypothetical protein